MVCVGYHVRCWVRGYKSGEVSPYRHAVRREMLLSRGAPVRWRLRPSTLVAGELRVGGLAHVGGRVRLRYDDMLVYSAAIDPYRNRSHTRQTYG